MNPVTVQLSTPITAYNKEVSALTLRAPTGKDVRECGSPTFAVTENGKVMGEKMDTAAIAKYLSNLASIPPSSVDLLSPSDWLECANGVLVFFQKQESPAPTSSTGTTSSPGSTATDPSSR